MIATALTLAFLGLLIWSLAAMFRRDADKIVAALTGNSWLAQPRRTYRPVTVRYAPRAVMAAPVQRQPAYRAAA